MKDTIYRQTAIDAIDGLPNCYNGFSDSYDKSYIIGVLEELPSAEPKTGKWIIRTRHEHYPSGKEYTELVCPFCGHTDHNGDGCYCGYCGCKMEVNHDNLQY